MTNTTFGLLLTFRTTVVWGGAGLYSLNIPLSWRRRQTDYILTPCIKPVAPQKNIQRAIISFNVGLSFRYTIAMVAHLQLPELWLLFSRNWWGWAGIISLGIVKHVSETSPTLLISWRHGILPVITFQCNSSAWLAVKKTLTLCHGKNSPLSEIFGISPPKQH